MNTLRTLIGTSMCLLLLAPGCERKEPEGEPPLTQVRAAVTAPEGMAAVREGAAVFMSRQPISLGEYVAYLWDTEQPVPPQWEGTRPGTPGAQAPVVGLSRDEAELYAVWTMNRLPEREDWTAAAAIVGSRPYPWEDDGSAVPDAALLLVRDWQPGSEQEQEALGLKAALPARILAGYQEAVGDVRKRIEELARDRKARVADLWSQIKPAFFNLLDKKKQLADLTARREKQGETLEILKTVLFEKGKMAAELKTQDLTPEEKEKLVQAYDEQLSNILAEIQEVRSNLQEANKKLQEQVVALTKRFEEGGALQVEVLSDAARKLLDDTAQAAASIREAVDWKVELQAVLESLEARTPILDRTPTLDDLKEAAAGMEQRIQQFGEDQEIAAQIDDVRNRIKNIGETVQREFLKEKLVFEELSGLVGLRASKEAIQATVDGLKEALGETPEPQDE